MKNFIQNKIRLPQFILKNELLFNEEIHNSKFPEKKRISVLHDPENSESGWILTFSEKNSGDWNVAHAYGEVSRSLKLLNSFPPDEEFQLLIERESLILPKTKPLFYDFADENQIIRFIFDHQKTTDNEQFPNEKITEKGAFSLIQNSGSRGLYFRLPQNSDFFPKNSFFSAIDKAPNFEKSQFLYNLPDLINKTSFVYLSEKPVCFIKPIHLTKNTVEIYIETDPGFRQSGLGSNLLSKFIYNLLPYKKTLIYLVFANNVPSIKLARKCRLTEHSGILRIPFKVNQVPHPLLLFLLEENY
ncbi:MAG: GNAT family N-acetyltransferase [Candidatus Riflebacteria bacterium]|nr:GNAT family N-acetyltransferase [Candidatus Riflebacteria bacterium]